MLETPNDIIELMASEGFKYRSACNCHGTYWEKFDRADGTRIKIAPRKNKFSVRHQPIAGTIEELKTKIYEIE